MVAPCRGLNQKGKPVPPIEASEHADMIRRRRRAAGVRMPIHQQRSSVMDTERAPDPGVEAYGPATISGEKVLELRRLYQRWLQELWPPETVQANDNPTMDLGYEPSRAGGRFWLARHERGASIGCLSAAPPSRDNQQVGIWVYVAPDWRGRGIGRRLLRSVNGFLRDEAIGGIQVRTSSKIPSGETFAERLQGEVFIRRHIHEAVLSEMDVELLRARSHAFRDPGLTLEVREGRYSVRDLEDLAVLRASIYSTYGFTRSAAEVRGSLLDFESIMERRGLRRIAVLAREKSTETVVGIAETIWNPESPLLLSDWYEAVARPWKGRRLAAGLTATLLLEVMARFSTVSVVRIGMHESARWLHARAEIIGFRPRHLETRWTISRQAIQRYLTPSGR